MSRHFTYDTKLRMRIRDELRELHRTYMRTFMDDPRYGNKTIKSKINSQHCTIKTSPT